MYGSDDPAVKAAALADQGRRNRGRKSIIKDAEKYAEELGVDIFTDEGKIKSRMREARIAQIKEAIANQPWFDSITKQRWEYEDSRSRLSLAERMESISCRYRSRHGGNYPTTNTANVYYSSKLGQNVNTTLCRLCQTKPKTVLHFLSGCPRLS